MTRPQLSPVQQQIVDHGEGPLLVIAGPGSGKTRVLTERVRRLLTCVPGHFHVMALTFTNKAANEMVQRLSDLEGLRQKATISTLHGFCLELLRDRGKPVGVSGNPQIFEHAKDRRQLLLEAALEDPLLYSELINAQGSKGRSRILDGWLKKISTIKTHPISKPEMDDPLIHHVLNAYDAGLRACGGYDYDDLLLLAYRLFTEFPKVADLYRRIYGYVCIDEAQDLNEAQYSVLVSLCGGQFNNVMMVGDPKQSIYGFNASGPIYMSRFEEEFHAIRYELNENHRSSQEVVRAAKSLDSSYTIQGHLPTKGEIAFLSGTDEKDEATIVCSKLKQLFTDGHQDVEGEITPSKCAILGRNRFTLLCVEKELKDQGIPFFKRVSSTHEYESPVVQEFLLALRVYANPLDRLHMDELAKRWGVDPSKAHKPEHSEGVISLLQQLAQQSNAPSFLATVQAMRDIHRYSHRLDLKLGIDTLRRYADTLSGMNHEEDRRIVYDDTEVLLLEWDHYLRSGTGPTLSGFMSSMALGITRQANHEGVALLTIHSSKGLEFDVVFIVGMVEGVFPDYRTLGDPKASLEERRNAFVAVTRSKRLLYFTYPKTREMPWDETWVTKPSSYLRDIE